MNYAVTLLVFNADGSGRILSISRGPYLDDWGLVGGKVEPGENLEDAIVREAHEEAEVKFATTPLPVFTTMALTRMCTTFLVTAFGLPPDLELPHTREGKVAWKHTYELCAPGSTYRGYNEALFKHLGLRWRLPGQRGPIR